MKKLWEKHIKQHPVAEAYCFGDTLVLDNKLVPYDVLGSFAHIKMLAAGGFLTQNECKALMEGLNSILALHEKGKFTVEPGDEDVHTKVEAYLTETLGDVGKKIHTGRSRNDQVLVDIRLYTKDQCFALAAQTLALAHVFAAFAGKYEFVAMPGYTHMQKAMPSSVGMWAGSFAESLLDDAFLLQQAFEINDQNPLGSGAAYGVPLPIDRNLTSSLLGFAKTQHNALYCQASRPKGQLSVMAALVQVMLTLSRFASDVLLFTTSEFGFFSVDETLCTGSSIMPQKKNLDVMEYLRARAHAVVADEQAVASIAAGLPSGYNADFGETKGPFMHAIETTLASLQVVHVVIDGLTPNVNALHDACTPELFATHAAYALVKQGIPFRDAYLAIGTSLKSLQKLNPGTVLKASSHIGGPGNLGLSMVKAAILSQKTWWDKKHAAFENVITVLKRGELYENKDKLY